MRTISNDELIQNYIDKFSLSRYFSPILLENFLLKQIEAGEFLLAQGSSLSSLYLLVNGKLQVEHYQKDGSCAVVRVPLFVQQSTNTLNPKYRIFNSQDSA